ncbi:MAG: T9SS type A sorting domain-containing protein, partial [Saprospiraceae bacterium]|nr:T9SS type A sorting domain-containing protein [Saprospiraceae bacterium]
MIRTLYFLFFSFYSFLIFSQSNPLLEMMLPPASDRMPEWANLLYEKPININKIDSAFCTYYSTHAFTKNHYTRYYKRLIKSYQSNFQSDGLIKEWSAEQWNEDRNIKEQSRLSNNQRTHANEWKDIGPRTTQWLANDNRRDTFCPWQANIYAFEISRSNPNVLYCVTETGSLFRSSNKGQSWILKGQNYVLNSEAIAIHPTNENTILVAVNSAIRRSTDGGNTFTTIFSSSNMGITDIRYSPFNTKLILAASTTGLWKSTDDGANWSKLISDHCVDIEYHPTLSSTIYVLKKNTTTNFYECWKSIDAGVSFQAKTVGWPKGLTNGIGRLAVSPAEPDWIYAVLLTNDRPRIMRSETKAESWTIAAIGETIEFGMDNWQGFYDLDLMVSPINAEIIIVGTGSTYFGFDKGSMFNVIGGYGGKFPLHPDLQVCRSNGNDAYICTDGGIMYSDDFFLDHATYRTFGITSTDLWGFGSGWNEDILVGGRYHNGNTVWHENYGPQTHLRMGGAEAPTGYVHQINNRQVYFSDIGSYIMGESKNEKVVQQTMSLWPNESYFNMEYSEIEFHPLYYNDMYLGKDASIYRSENNGVSFTKLFTVTDPGAVIQHIEISRENPNIMFFCTRSNSPSNGKIWKTEDGGKTWKETTPIPVSNGQRRITQICLSEKNILYAALRTGSNGNKIFKSEDLGNSWINWTTSELNDVTLDAITYQLSSPNETVYLSGGAGKTFFRNKNMSSWELYNSNLPVNHYSRQTRPFYRDNKLRSGASNGIWEISLAEKSVPFAQASVDKRSTACARDTFYFDDFSVLEYDGKHEWEWNFPGARFVSNNKIRNPKVVFSGPGEYDVTLTVTNSAGKSSRTFSKMITVEPSSCNIDLAPATALSMNGTNQVITLPAIPQLKNATGITVMCWIKIHDKQQWFTQLISNWGSSSNFGFGFAFQGYVPTTNLTFSWNNVPYQLTTSHEVPINQWTHVAVTVDTGKAVVYMDGKAWTRRQKFSIDLSKTPFTMGGGVPGQGGTFNGFMDEFKFYKRALTQSEIREQMHLITKEADPDQVLYYQFNELNPNVIYDKLGVVHGLNGASELVKSRIAAGPGVSDRISVTKNQSYVFPNTNTELEFSTGTIPNGEMVLSRIQLQPDTIDFPYNQLANEYFVLRNWGSNASFNSLTKINIDSTKISSKNSQLHYRSAANAEGANWRLSTLKGTNQTLEVDGNTSFLNVNQISSSSQWIISGEKIITESFDLDKSLWKVYPNPTEEVLFIQNLNGDVNKTTYTLIDASGKKINEREFVNLAKINVSNLSTGIYYLQLSQEEKLIGNVK